MLSPNAYWLLERIDLGQKGSSKIVFRYLSHMRYEVEFLAHVSISLVIGMAIGMAINNTLLVNRMAQTRY